MFKVKIYTKLYGLGGENGCLVFISLFFSHSSGDVASRCVCVCVCFRVHHLIKVRLRVPGQEPSTRRPALPSAGSGAASRGCRSLLQQNWDGGTQGEPSQARLCHRKARS